MAFYAATVRGLCREVAFRFSVVEQVKKRDWRRDRRGI